MDTQQMVDEAVAAYEEMMRKRAELAPLVDRANALAQGLVDATIESGADPAQMVIPFLKRIAAADHDYADQTLSTQFHFVIGDAIEIDQG